MSIQINNFNSTSTVLGTLFRRDLGLNEQKFITTCAGKHSREARAKFCQLIFSTVKENQTKISSCSNLCRSQECLTECIYKHIEFDVNEVERDPFVLASNACPLSQDDLKSCKAACKPEEKEKCEKVCEKNHKYGDVTCISKKVNVPEDSLVKLVDCTSEKCLDIKDAKLSKQCNDNCIAKAVGEKPNFSSSRRITTSGLITIAVAFFSFYGNLY